MTLVLTAAFGVVVGLVIGTLGGGGGVLAVPALVYGLGLDARAATTASIIIVGVISAAGALARARRTVDWRVGIVFGVVGLPTAWAGSLLNRTVPEPALLLSFAVLTVVVAVLMLVSSSTESGSDQAGDPETSDGISRLADGALTPASTRTAPDSASPGVPTSRRAAATQVAKMVASGAAVGFLTGFLGVGGGFLVVPALTIVLGLSMPLAIGTSLLVIALNSISSLVARIGHLQLDWAVVLPFTAVAVVATLAGKMVADRMSSAALTRAFAVLLILVGAGVGTESLLTSGLV